MNEYSNLNLIKEDMMFEAVEKTTAFFTKSDNLYGVSPLKVQ